jgi:hypothetical protein
MEKLTAPLKEVSNRITEATGYPRIVSGMKLSKLCHFY